MTGIPLEHGLALAGVLFCIGLVGLMVRRNIRDRKSTRLNSSH